MKKNLYFLLALPILFILSCSKKECCTLPPTFYMQAQLGKDSTWTATPEFSLDSTTSKTWVATNSTERSMWIRLKKSSDTQWVLDTAGFYVTIGRDVFLAEYGLATDTTNTFLIKKEDETALKGTFDLTFKELNTANRLHFSLGEFRIPTKKE